MAPQPKSIQFIGKFLSWYQDSFSQADVVNRVKLEELVREAEDIHTEVMRKINEDIDNLARATAQQAIKLYNKKYKSGVVSQKCSLLEEVYRANLNKIVKKKVRKKRVTR